MKIRKVLSVLLMASIGVCTLAGCMSTNEEVTTPTGETEPPVTVQTEIRELAAGEEDSFRDGYMDFTMNLINKCIEAGGSESNVMVSPASVMLALDMTASGARGDTLTEIMALYGGGNDPQGQLSYASYLMNRMNSSEGVMLHAANSMWINETILPEPLNDEFIDFVTGAFDAEANRLVFDSVAEDQINGWVSDKTDKMIPTIVDGLDQDMAMMLINAIAFDGKWQDQYKAESVHEDKFTRADGTEQDVQMMYSLEHTYLENEYATGFAKYYEGGRYAFVVMLPKDESQSAGDLLKKFDGDTLTAYLNSADHRMDVRARMPEFTYDWDSSLKSVLKALGMETPFSGSADFSGIVTLDNDNFLYIGDVIHKTHIDVDRNGTRAAAVTAIELYRATAMLDEPEYKEVFCNRPYAYAIVDMEEGTPLFIGTVNEV